MKNLARLRGNQWLTALAITLVVGTIAILINWPAGEYRQAPSDFLTQDGLQGFSKSEKQGETAFNWSNAPEALLIYPRQPRYTPLDYHLRYDLQRPPGAPPANIEVYENTADPTGEPRLLTRLVADPQKPGPQDLYLTIPPRPAGKGLLIQFKINTFKYGNDPRPLGFMFLGADVHLPKSHLLRLFWPNPYWPAMLILLLVVSRWALRVGLDGLETLLLSGMLGLVISTGAISAYGGSGWLFGLAILLALLYGLFEWRPAWGQWLIGAGAVLLVLFFLFSADENQADLGYYLTWSRDVHANGVWNVYGYDPKIDYPPLLMYLLWFYNLFSWNFGWQESALAWKGFVSLLHLALLAVLYLIIRQEKATKTAENRWLVLLGFNAALFYSTTVWDQTDALPLLCQALALYFIYRRQALPAGLMLGLTLIAKFQGWFALPLLAWWLVQRCGWRRGLSGLALGGLVAGVMAGIAFGFDLGAVQRWANSPELAGSYENQFPTAFNLDFLLLGQSKTALPAWLSLLGFAVVGLAMAAVIWRSRGRARPLVEYELGAGWVVTTCFAFLIKMKERYLLYNLPFLALAAFRERRLVKLLLAANWLQLIHLIAGLLNQSSWKKTSLGDYPFIWSNLLNQELTQRFFALTTLALWLWLGLTYWQTLRRTASPNQPDLPTNDLSSGEPAPLKLGKA